MLKIDKYYTHAQYMGRDFLARVCALREVSRARGVARETSDKFLILLIWQLLYPYVILSTARDKHRIST